MSRTPNCRSSPPSPRRRAGKPVRPDGVPRQQGSAHQAHQLVPDQPERARPVRLRLPAAVDGDGAGRDRRVRVRRGAPLQVTCRETSSEGCRSQGLPQGRHAAEKQGTLLLYFAWGTPRVSTAGDVQATSSRGCRSQRSPHGLPRAASSVQGSTSHCKRSTVDIAAGVRPGNTFLTHERSLGIILT